KTAWPQISGSELPSAASSLLSGSGRRAGARGSVQSLIRGPVAQSGQSSGLIIRWLQVQVLPGPQTTYLVQRPEMGVDLGKVAVFRSDSSSRCLFPSLGVPRSLVQQGCNKKSTRWDPYS